MTDRTIGQCVLCLASAACFCSNHPSAGLVFMILLVFA